MNQKPAFFQVTLGDPRNGGHIPHLNSFFFFKRITLPNGSLGRTWVWIIFLGNKVFEAEILVVQLFEEL